MRGQALVPDTHEGMGTQSSYSPVFVHLKFSCAGSTQLLQLSGVSSKSSCLLFDEYGKFDTSHIYVYAMQTHDYAGNWWPWGGQITDFLTIGFCNSQRINRVWAEPLSLVFREPQFMCCTCRKGVHHKIVFLFLPYFLLKHRVYNHKWNLAIPHCTKWDKSPKALIKIKPRQTVLQIPRNKKNIGTEKHNPLGSFVAAAPGIYVLMETCGS